MSESVAARWLRRLRTGEGVAPGWPGVCSITNGLLSGGLPESTIRALLLDESHEGVAYLHFSSAGKPRSASWREKNVDRALRNAHERQARSKPARDKGAVLEELAKIRDAIDARPVRWKGRAGATDLAVVRAVIGKAEALGRFEFDLGVRELADEAGVGVHGAHKALGRLHHWVRVVERGKGTRASTLRLERQPRELTGSVSTRWTDVSSRDERVVNHGNATEHRRHLAANAWRWPALGKSAQRTYELLGSEPIETKEVAAALGVKPAAARHHLRRLEAFELAERVLDGWVVGPADLDQVATELGPEVARAGEEQRKRHADNTRERRKWAEARRRKRQPRERKDAREDAVAEVVSSSTRRIDPGEALQEKVEAGARA